MGWFSRSSAPKPVPPEPAPKPVPGPTVFETHVHRGGDALLIIKAYEMMVRTLGPALFPPGRWETVRQYFSRIGAHPGLDIKSLEVFASTFEEARYSDQPIGSDRKARALYSLRAVKYSVDVMRAGPSVQVAAPAVPASWDAGIARPGYWVIAPAAAAGQARPDLEASGNSRPAAPSAAADAEAFRRAWGAKSIPAGARIPEDAIAAIKESLARQDLVRLGGLLLEQGDGPASSWRAFLDSSLAEYLLKFDDQALVAGGARPSSQEWERVLRAGQVLAVSEGRDFFVPDDLKLSLLSVGTVVYRLRSAQVAGILEGGTAEAGAGADKALPAFWNGLAVPVL